MRATIIIIWLSILCAIQMFGQEQNSQNQAIQTDTLKAKKVSTLIVPIVFYSPETNFAFGGGAQMYFNTGKSNSETLNSSVLFSGIYTLNQQLMIEIQPQIYFNYENFLLDSKFIILNGHLIIFLCHQKLL